MKITQIAASAALLALTACGTAATAATQSNSSSPACETVVAQLKTFANQVAAADKTGNAAALLAQVAATQSALTADMDAKSTPVVLADYESDLSIAITSFNSALARQSVTKIAVYCR